MSQFERLATRVQAEAARRLADSLSYEPSRDVSELFWFPRSRHPDRAYPLYLEPPGGFVVVEDQLLLNDLVASNLQPGYTETEFQLEIRSLLAELPLATAILDATEDTILTLSDALSQIEYFSTDGFTPSDLWNAFVEWMAHFFSDQVMKQQITEVALRRARILR